MYCIYSLHRTTWQRDHINCTANDRLIHWHPVRRPRLNCTTTCTTLMTQTVHTSLGQRLSIQTGCKLACRWVSRPCVSPVTWRHVTSWHVIGHGWLLVTTDVIPIHCLSLRSAKRLHVYMQAALHAVSKVKSGRLERKSIRIVAQGDASDTRQTRTDILRQQSYLFTILPLYRSWS